jgi:hypothetical protein
MHNSHYDDLLFAPTYVARLKQEIRITMEPHVPTIVTKAVVIARISAKSFGQSQNQAPKEPISQQSTKYQT